MRSFFSLLLPVLTCTSVAAGTMDTVAGTGAKGYAGDGGPAVKATLNEPFHCNLDGKGNLYVAEASNHCILDGAGVLYIADSENQRVRRVRWEAP